MPEAPKQNFFAKLFAANSMIDPDELCKNSFEKKARKIFLYF
jgi:hypothetical protein